MVQEGHLLKQSGTPNQYQYNGKELNDDFDLNWNDYGARWYDSSIGRWNSVDALAEHPNQIDKSVYAYGWNNPIKYDDPDGNCPICPGLLAGAIAAAVDYGTQVATNVYKNGEFSKEALYQDISVSSIVFSAGEGFITSGASISKQIAVKGGAALINNAIEVKTGTTENGQILNVEVELNPTNIVKNAGVDLLVDQVGGVIPAKIGKTVKNGSEVVTKTVEAASETVTKTLETGTKAVSNKTVDNVKVSSNQNIGNNKSQAIFKF